MIGQILSASAVAYGFSRFRFPGREPLFFVVLSTMMLPWQVTIVPTFLLFRYVGWINTFWPLIIPSFFGGGAFYIFLLRQFFMTIPRDLDEAAKIDGANLRAHLLEHPPAAGQTGRRHGRHFFVHRTLERVYRPLDLPQLSRTSSPSPSGCATSRPRPSRAMNRARPS